MIRTAVMLGVLVLGSSAGEISLTRGARLVGEPPRLRPRELLTFLWRAVRNGWFWAGVPLLALAFGSLLVLLSWEPISLVIPVSALSYVVGTLLAKYVLGEEVNHARWAGIILVSVGVALAAAG